MKIILLALHFAQICFLLLWQWREPSPVAEPLVIAFASILPLLSFTGVLWRPFRNGLVFYLLVQLLYFIHAVSSVWQPSGHWLWPGTGLLLSLATFGLAFAHGRKLP